MEAHRGSTDRKAGRESDGEDAPDAEAPARRHSPWTQSEHLLFLLGLEDHGRGAWRAISMDYCVSRTPTQVASHAQKYFLRQELTPSRRHKKRPSIHDITCASINPYATAAERDHMRLTLQEIVRSGRDMVNGGDSDEASASSSGKSAGSNCLPVSGPVFGQVFAFTVDTTAAAAGGMTSANSGDISFGVAGAQKLPYIMQSMHALPASSTAAMPPGASWPMPGGALLATVPVIPGMQVQPGQFYGHMHVGGPQPPCAGMTPPPGVPLRPVQPAHGMVFALAGPPHARNMLPGMQRQVRATGPMARFAARAAAMHPMHEAGPDMAPVGVPTGAAHAPEIAPLPAASVAAPPGGGMRTAAQSAPHNMAPYVRSASKVAPAEAKLMEQPTGPTEHASVGVSVREPTDGCHAARASAGLVFAHGKPSGEEKVSSVQERGRKRDGDGVAIQAQQPPQMQPAQPPPHTLRSAPLPSFAAQPGLHPRQPTLMPLPWYQVPGSRPTAALPFHTSTAVTMPDPCNSDSSQLPQLSINRSLTGPLSEPMNVLHGSTASSTVGSVPQPSASDLASTSNPCGSSGSGTLTPAAPPPLPLPLDRVIPSMHAAPHPMQQHSQAWAPLHGSDPSVLYPSRPTWPHHRFPAPLPASGAAPQPFLYTHPSTPPLPPPRAVAHGSLPKQPACSAPHAQHSTTLPSGHLGSLSNGGRAERVSMSSPIQPAAPASAAAGGWGVDPFGLGGIQDPGEGMVDYLLGNLPLLADPLLDADVFDTSSSFGDSGSGRGSGGGRAQS